MSLINGVDKQSIFFPFNQDNNALNKIDGNINDNLTANAANGNPDFQTVFKSLLDSMLSNESNSQVNIDQNSVGNSLTSVPGIDNNLSSLLTLLEQLQEPDLLSEGSEQATDTKSIPDMLSAQMISKYLQAMRNFQNTSNPLPTGTLDGVNLNTMQKLMGEDPGVIQSISGTNIPSLNPSKQEVIDYITEQCRITGLPEQLGLATAATESDLTQFHKDGTPLRSSNPDSADWGIMQINDKAWGDTYDFNRIKSDWRYNIRAGLQILKSNYDAAIKHQEGIKGANRTDENLARAAYSGYNAGTGNLWRYRTPVDDAPKTGLYDVLDNEGFDIRDIRFWNNYQKLG
jgi:hypothetical protein